MAASHQSSHTVLSAEDNDIKAHYETLLAAHYTWMCGGRGAGETAAANFFRAHGVIPSEEKPDTPPTRAPLAVDLGCGSGFQSVPLAAAGYRVLAVDLSPTLLAEVDALREPRVTTVEADLLDFASRCVTDDDAPDVVVCMGDTLPSLPTLADVSRLFVQVRAALAKPDGVFCLSFRALAGAPRASLDRFLPVRADADRVFTCFLEYFDEYVQVYDLVYARRDGNDDKAIDPTTTTSSTTKWDFHKSSYRKLRLSRDYVLAELRAAGFRVDHASTENGMTFVVARLPTAAPTCPDASA